MRVAIDAPSRRVANDDTSQPEHRAAISVRRRSFVMIIGVDASTVLCIHILCARTAS
uniref:Transposase n=1 Tax=Ascaris lumbricoides TaxID=6252 RepID=A0A0M3I2N9_ASCLU